MGLFDFLNFGAQVAGQLLNQNNQERAWEREDTAIQRRVADLKAAGLSPVLAAGVGASSMAPIRIEAPQYVPSVENMSANIARTNADRAMIAQQMDINHAKAFPEIAMRDYAGFNEKTAQFLGKSEAERRIVENEEAVRNIRLYQLYGVPSIGTAGDNVISNTLMLKNLFPDLDPSKAGGMGVLMQLLQSTLNSIGGVGRMLSPGRSR